jgi:DNA polymerase III delta prime subunit
VLGLAHARKVLAEDHLGLDEIKSRILDLEHLAVLTLNPDAKAAILLFVGPPGVGKTSLGKSMARAQSREFQRMRLGGLHDEAELRGHRRTHDDGHAAIRKSRVGKVVSRTYRLREPGVAWLETIADRYGLFAPRAISNWVIVRTSSAETARYHARTKDEARCSSHGSVAWELLDLQ